MVELIIWIAAVALLLSFGLIAYFAQSRTRAARTKAIEEEDVRIAAARAKYADSAILDDLLGHVTLVPVIDPSGNIIAMIPEARNAGEQLLS